MSGTRRVVIIGGGVIGRCAAYSLLQRGHAVVVLDRGSERGCSFGNAGMVVPSHLIPLAAPGVIGKGLRWMFDAESPFRIKPRLSGELLSWIWNFARAATPARVAQAVPVLRDLSLESRRLFVEMSGENGFDFGLVQKGLLMLCRSEEVLHEEAELAATANANGVPAEVLGADAVRKLDPSIEMDITGGVYFPQDCHLSPRRFLDGLDAAIRRMGGEILDDVEVTGIEKNGRRVTRVTASNGRNFEAEEFLLAGGSWSPRLARGLSVRIPMQAGKGYSITVEKPAALPELCSILCEAKIAVTPMGGTLRFAGTMEIAGLDGSVSGRRVMGMRKAVPRYFPQFKSSDLEGQTVWSGLRPCSPDGLPYIGRFRAYDNLTAATGHAMLGLSLGPVTGALVADILSEDKPRIDLAALSPDRYA